ncbi:uncharacterized protein LOC114264571 isoform X2 [Camellia sinensis]|uniref:uncharacterized protein LOC114264571 isoform X2 n=1 Tax=Camellia sinensis TaxID=4442 RepID=UPI0010364D69|nr:uncharacterized protein LOC114264571 isoform X2 [Camellia sinensis]
MLINRLSLTRSSYLCFPLSSVSRSRYISKCTSKVMGLDNFPLISQKTHANFRLCNVSGYTTNLLEIRAEDPSLHVLFIPGNPGVISFYTDFLENLYELLGGTASITDYCFFGDGADL